MQSCLFILLSLKHDLTLLYLQSEKFLAPTRTLGEGMSSVDHPLISQQAS